MPGPGLMRWWLGPSLAALLTLAPAEGYEGGPVADPGRIAGRAQFRGILPPTRPLSVDRNVEACGNEIPDESLVVDSEGGLANVIVLLEGIQRGKPVDLTIERLLDNRGCRFVPHVLAMSKGQVLRVRNSDPLLHSVHATAGGEETAFNLALPIQNQTLRQRMRREGILTVRCDSGHRWMSAVIAVEDHPYLTVTDAAGRFTLDQVPPGRYRLKAWHELLGERAVDIEVAPGSEARQDFGFALP